MRIVTHYDPKPIPGRRYDWSAVTEDYDGPGSPIGWGRTEDEARADLFAQMEETMDPDSIRAELAQIERRAKQIDRAAFVTLTIWPTGQDCGPFIASAHMLDLNATADTAAGALAGLGRLMDARDPAKLEAEGWATLGALPAPPDAPCEEVRARRDR